MRSLNNRFVLEQYVKKELKAETSGGFAKMAHKISLAPLKVLVETSLPDGTLVPVGSTAYVKEETLFLKTGAGQFGGPAIPSFMNDKISDKPFIILEANQIEVIDINKEVSDGNA